MEIWKQIFQRKSCTTPKWGAPHFQTPIFKWELPQWGLQSTLGSVSLCQPSHVANGFLIKARPNLNTVKQSFLDTWLSLNSMGWWRPVKWVCLFIIVLWAVAWSFLVPAFSTRRRLWNFAPSLIVVVIVLSDVHTTWKFFTNSCWPRFDQKRIGCRINLVEKKRHQF